MGNVVDSIPVVSQVKSAVEAISGDTDAARRTQEHFVNLTPGVSQIKSLVEAASGDTDAAARTQESFLRGLTGIDVNPSEFHVDANEKATTAAALQQVRASGRESMQATDLILQRLASSTHFEDLHLVIDIVQNGNTLLQRLKQVRSYWTQVLDQVQKWLQRAAEIKNEGQSYLRYLNIALGTVAAFYSAFGPSTAEAEAHVKTVGQYVDSLETQFVFLHKAITEAQLSGQATLEQSQVKVFGKFVRSFKDNAHNLKSALLNLEEKANKMEEELAKV